MIRYALLFTLLLLSSFLLSCDSSTDVPSQIDTLYISSIDTIIMYDSLLQIDTIIIDSTQNKATITDNFLVSNGIIFEYYGTDTALTIPDSLAGQEIIALYKELSFSPKLTSITIPSSLLSIGKETFKSNHIHTLILPPHITTIASEAFYMNEISRLTIPASCTHIGPGAFFGNSITELIIEEGLTAIEDATFGDNLLTTLSIPATVTHIGGGAFRGNKLEEVTFSNGLLAIGGGAFFSNNLTAITIPKSVTTIGPGAFSNNPLSSITIEGDSTRFNSQWDEIAFPDSLKPTP